MAKKIEMKIAESEKNGKLDLKPWSETFDSFPEEVKLGAKRRAAEITAVDSLRTCLKELRKSAGLGQVELAKRMGVTQPTIAQIEKQGDVKISTLQNVAMAAGAQLSIHIDTADGQHIVFAIPKA